MARKSPTAEAEPTLAERLEKSRTFENLRKAFLEEAALAFRYRHFAVLAEFEGLERHAAAFNALAEGGASGVGGCFDFLRWARDPQSGIAVGGTSQNLEALLQSETRQHAQVYPEMARTARGEGFPDIASWFETLEKYKRSSARKLKKLRSR